MNECGSPRQSDHADGARQCDHEVIGSSPIVGSSIYAGSLKSDLSLHCGFESSRKHIKSAGIPPFRLATKLKQNTRAAAIFLFRDPTGQDLEPRLKPMLRRLFS